MTTLDLRQAYLESVATRTLQRHDRDAETPGSWRTERPTSSGEWGNASRTFDAVRLRYESKDWRLDAFTSSVVSFRDGQLNQSDWLDW